MLLISAKTFFDVESYLRTLDINQFCVQSSLDIMTNSCSWMTGKWWKKFPIYCKMKTPFIYLIEINENLFWERWNFYCWIIIFTRFESWKDRIRIMKFLKSIMLKRSHNLSKLTKITVWKFCFNARRNRSLRSSIFLISANIFNETTLGHWNEIMVPFFERKWNYGRRNWDVFIHQTNPEQLFFNVKKKDEILKVLSFTYA